MARRRPDELIAIEERILAAGLQLQDRDGAFHGFALAKAMAGREDGSGLTAHGTLYKALTRLSERGLLSHWWEDADLAAEHGRPRRRLYRVTGAGEVALSRARAADQGSPARVVPPSPVWGSSLA